MLAPSFLSPVKLKIKKAEYDGLLSTLQLLEGGDIEKIKDGNYDASASETAINFERKFFNMSVGGAATLGRKCGTAGCIGGWTAAYMGKKTVGGMNDYIMSGHSSVLQGLYYPEDDLGDGNYVDYGVITVGEAAAALRNFLTTGKPKWTEVLGKKVARYRDERW